MTSPSQHYVTWYRSLSVVQRADVAFMVGAHLPANSLSVSMELEVLVEAFVDWIEQAAAGSALRDVAMTVSLIAVTEFFIIFQRDNLHSFAGIASKLNRLARETGNEVFAQSATQQEFAGRQWIAACDKWKLLRASALSDTSMRIWSDQQLIASSSN